VTDDTAHGGWSKLASDKQWLRSLATQTRRTLADLCWLSSYHSFLCRQREAGRSGLAAVDEMFEEDPQLRVQRDSLLAEWARPRQSLVSTAQNTASQ